MNPAYIFTLLLLAFLPLYIILSRKNSRKLPPGSWGLPFLGQTLSFVHAMRTNTAENWVQERVRKYGPIWKLNILGTPTVFLHGQAANKFIYTCDRSTLGNQKPASIRRIIGERNVTEVSGSDHKHVRGALVSFLKPEVLKMYVGRMDEEVGKHMEMHWHGKEQVQAMPLMKTLSFNIMSSLIIGIEQGSRRETLIELFKHLMEGLLSVPVNLLFTRFNRSLRASAKIRAMVRELIRQKREALNQHSTTASANEDLISCLLSLRNEDNSILLSDEEIINNAILIMIAGHDTTSILITFLIRLLANDPSVYATIAQEQEEIARSKASGELLTWDDLAKMKYTWRVAMETLRMIPPVFCSFRKVLTDFEYEGYIIPKGWQVMWAACMTHMDERIFPDPSKFDATRFEKQVPPPPPYSFVAFGGGSRMCPGNEFARIETLVTIHYLVSKFTWKLSCSRDDSFFRDPMPSFKHGLTIQIKPKQDINT